jgi:hypothetical protein
MSRIIQEVQISSTRDKAMSKPKSNVSPVDVKRLICGAKKAGVEIARVEVEGGKITLIPRSPSNGAQAAENALDGWMASHARSA